MITNNNFLSIKKNGLSRFKPVIWPNSVMFLFVYLFLFMPQITYTQESGLEIPKKYPPVPILSTQLRELKSSLVNQEYHLYIHLPRTYWDEKTRKSYPVMYLLDAQWDFPLVTAIYGSQYYDGFLDEIIIVGITWGGENPNYDELRVRDFTSVQDSVVLQTGGAAKFLSALKEKIIPFVETEYPVKKNDRGLMGSSLGGFFTLYAMFNDTQLFNRYIVSSPALRYRNRIAYQYESDYAEKNTNLSANVFMVLGEYEDVNEFMNFTDCLKKRNYKGLNLESTVVKGVGHSGHKAEGFTRGMQFVYARPALKLPEEILEKYIGNYDVQGRKIQFVIEDGNLVSIDMNNSRMVWNAETSKDFYIKGTYQFVHFLEDQDGQTTGFKVEFFNGSFLAEKVK
jgi:predicted alpha/beta superfamily hydrolase